MNSYLNVNERKIDGTQQVNKADSSQDRPNLGADSACMQAKVAGIKSADIAKASQLSKELCDFSRNAALTGAQRPGSNF